LRRSVAISCCVLAYLVIGLLATLPAFLHGPAHTLQCGGCADVGQEVWFLRWPSAALSGQGNLLVSSLLNVPFGVNLMQNTSMPLVGVVLAPLVLLAGPVVSLNVGFLLAFASSGTACLLAALRFTTRVPAAFAAGLLYAFSPFMIGAGRDHLFLVAGALPPLMAICVHEILVRGRRPYAAGVFLGLIAAAQLLVSIEVLAMFALVGLLAVATVVLSRRLRPPQRLDSPGRAGPLALGLAAIVFAVLAAYPIYVFAAGPDRPSTPGHPQAVLAHLSIDLAGIVAPDANQRFDLGFGPTTRPWVRQVAVATPSSGDLDENGGYVGVPLLLLLVAGVARHRRDPVVRFLAVLAGLSLLLALGARLHVAGHETPVPLPFALVVKVPFLRGEVAARYCDVMWLCLAFLVARLLEDTASEGGRVSPRAARLRMATTGAVAALAVLSLLPAWPYHYAPVKVPPWFTSKAASSVPSGTSVLSYPFPRKPHAEEMLWQAVAGMSFRIPAGQAILGRTRTSATETVFDACLETGRPAPLTARRVALMRHDLSAFDVSRVVIPETSPHWRCAASAMTVVLGGTGALAHDAEVWTIGGAEEVHR
jgi:hypothetical protein